MAFTKTNLVALSTDEGCSKSVILLLVFLGFTLISNAQSAKLENKGYSTAEVEFIFPNNFSYNYGTDRGGASYEFSPSGFLLKSFGAQYTYNYIFFKKLSLGALAGFQTYSYPKDFFMIKAGGIIKYFFADRDNVFIYTQSAHFFSLDKSQFKKGGNLRLGIGLPVFKRDNFNITTNIFAEHNNLNLNGADPIFDFEVEEPDALTIKGSFGISFGVQF